MAGKNVNSSLLPGAIVRNCDCLGIDNPRSYGDIKQFIVFVLY